TRLRKPARSRSKRRAAATGAPPSSASAEISRRASEGASDPSIRPGKGSADYNQCDGGSKPGVEQGKHEAMQRLGKNGMRRRGSGWSPTWGASPPPGGGPRATREERRGAARGCPPPGRAPRRGGHVHRAKREKGGGRGSPAGAGPRP